MAIPLKLMDNHKGALQFWQELGVSGATCVHVDAHLDASNFGVPEPGELEHPEINCGNFLLPALHQGLVEHLIWVVPPHLADGQPLLPWARHELQNWMWLTADEFRSLHLDGPRVEGTMAGRRLTICQAGDLPALPGPVLVDIDVDYHFKLDDTIWQTPMQLHDLLRPLTPAAVTVAASVEGGYTPLQHRYSADITALCWSGQRGRADTLWGYLHHGLDVPDAPAWAQAARCAVQACQQGAVYEGPGWEAAARLDDGYRPVPLDVAAYYLHRKAFDRCAPWLARVGNGLPGLTARYMEGLIAWRQGRWEEADAAWAQVLQADLPGAVLAHVEEMRAKALADAGRPGLAVLQFQAAILRTPPSPERASRLRQLGHAYRALGQPEQAARTWRQAVRLVPDHLATLPIRWELAQMYVATGQIMLAQAELAHLLRQDDDGLAAKARVLALSLKPG
ncbi:MAG TPA: hypothetical protein VGO93_23550 [Candidatus Xenobia bacterium]